MGDRNRVCPAEMAGGLDNSLRRFLQNPTKILEPYIKSDMKVLDFGCGPGFFTIEIAKMVSGGGSVIAADLQSGMLDIVKKKISGTEQEKRVRFHKCEQNSSGLSEEVDFIFAFYVVHEVPDKDRLFREFRQILKPGGKLLVIEPNFHVPKKDFNTMLEKLVIANFRIIDRPGKFLNRCVLAG